MAETFIFSIAEQLLEKLSSPIVQEISFAWGVRNDLRRLENTVSYVRAVLLDAQERQVNSHQLKNWLEKLENALYRAQEVLEEFEINALRNKVCDRTIIRKVRRVFSDSNRIVFRFKMAHRIKKIRGEFDEIAANRNKFNLIERFDERVVVNREMTHSFLREEDVIGREKERETVIRFLMTKVDDESVSVLPIIGLGGMGKTILAKLVYNDERVVTQFDLRIWVCFPEEFELGKVIEKILKSTGVIDCDDLPLEQLQKYLREKLENHNYLLILDDVWNENHVKWKALRDLLIGGSGASKIIVTTRNESVASIMGTTDLNIEVKGLSYEECLSLFFKCAFRSSKDAARYPHLVEIAGSIVKKCKGVPLAVRTLGSILYTKTDEREWTNVRDNEIWNIEQKEGDIMPSLKLSYYQLPSNLRRCFAFCSIFPKDYQFYNILLSLFWQANGLLGNNCDVDNVGMMYIKQLQSRGFFQDFENYGGFVRFKMHDFVHDLALLVAGHDCISMNSLEGLTDKNKKYQEVRDCLSTRMARHVSFPRDYFLVEEIPNWLLEHKENVHTFVFPNGVGPSKASFIETCISKFKSLRLLDLSKSSFDVLPSSICNLMKLKHLDLSHNIQLKALPASICELVGLEALHFTGCLNIEKLPRELGQLIRLKSLAISTKEIKLPENEIRRLTSLQHFIITCCPNLKFVMSDEAIQCLSSLRSLYIRQCGSLVSLPVRGLRHLTLLESLNLSICGHLNFTINNYSDNGETENIRGEEGLCNLHSLSLGKMPKLESLPRLLLHGAKHLKYIGISECDNLTNLMPELMLESLKSLQKLRINSCPKLKSLPEKMCCLTALNEVIISDCPELVSRCQRETGEDWHKICYVPNVYLDGIKI